MFFVSFFNVFHGRKGLFLTFIVIFHGRKETIVKKILHLPWKTTILFTYFYFSRGRKYFLLKNPSSSMEDERSFLFSANPMLPWKTGVFSLFNPFPPWWKSRAPLISLFRGAQRGWRFTPLYLKSSSSLPGALLTLIVSPSRSVLERIFSHTPSSI